MFTKLKKIFSKNSQKCSDQVLVKIPELDFFPVVLHYDYGKGKFKIQYNKCKEFTAEEIKIATEKFIQDNLQTL